MADLKEFFKNMEFGGTDDGLGYNSRVLLIDAMNLFIRNYAAVPSMDDDGNHIGGMVGFLKSLGLAIRTFKPSRTIIVFDGKGGSQRRRKIFPQYKQNRKPPVRLNRAYDLTTDEQEKQNMKWQLITLIELLECLPVTIMALDNVEADDVIAYLTQLITEVGGESIIYSTDKDFFQLASDNVIVYNPVKKKTFTQEQILEDFGIHPKHFHLYRALDGDKSDNIDGVKGVGTKSLVKYVPEIGNPDTEITIDFIRKKYADEKKPPKIVTNILNNLDVVERNLQLMNLHEGIMSNDARLKVQNIFDNADVVLDKHTLTTLMIKNKLFPSIPGFDGWIAQNFIPLQKYYNESRT